MTDVVELRRGTYHDSVSLMQASQALARVDGVDAALVAMATDLNLDVAAGMGFATPPDAGSNDLLVAVRARDDDAAARALAELARLLAGLGRRADAAAGLGAAPPPRTTGSAARRAGDATLALVSVPGPHAFAEAMDALAAGLDVMVFSDNVPLAQEVRLKDEGARRGRLVMGPDCGTAIVNGVGLGFANAVRRGPVGVVAASGTGAQQLTCLLDASGVGVSHVLGVGGRDLSAAVGGRSTLQALALLDDDPDTEVVVLVSKPPAAEVADRVRAVAATLRAPVVTALLGRGRPDLTAVAEDVVRRVGGSWAAPRTWVPPTLPRAGRGALRGLFAGGTLCDEAMAIAAETLGVVRSNIPLEPGWALPDDLVADGHAMVDFGDDRLTRGRPHPMIDNRARLDRLAREAADPSVAVALLDVVLGHAAHPDPAGEIGPAIAAARDIPVVVSLCGTAADPQGLDRQAGALAAAGAVVHLSNAAAARAAVALTVGGAQ